MNANYREEKASHYYATLRRRDNEREYAKFKRRLCVFIVLLAIAIGFIIY